MSEGMATLSEIDYTYARRFASVDRDRYLAQRFIPIAMDLQTVGTDLPAVQLQPGDGLGQPYGTPEYTMWAYEKTAATLDHLRVTIGEDVFTRALGAYVTKCSYVGCSPDDFRSVLEEASGTTLVPFFDRWVTGTARPHVTIEPRGATASVRKDDDAPMTLELWVRLEDGSLVKRRVQLVGRETTVALGDVGGVVRSVSANPRHDVLVDVRSAIDGDLDFDGETDGFDLLRCTRLAGVSYMPKTQATGLWNVDEQFDPRCDLDGNHRIDDEDLVAIMDNFGKLREP
jgi:hypothetical protein